MTQAVFVDSAKVMSKGQVTIPKDVRDVLGIKSGDRVTFIVEGKTVRVVNSAEYAMLMLQQEMKGAAKAAGIVSEDDVSSLVEEIRSGT